MPKAPARSPSADPHVVGTISMLRGGPDVPLYKRLFMRIRDLIAQGRLAPGARLPASRALAGFLGVSRNSVSIAFEHLAADGWVEARRGAGVFVARDPPVKASTPPPRKARDVDPELRPFSLQVPALDLFPIAAWNRLQSRRWRTMPAEALAEGHGAGWPGLRDAIAAHLATTRGLRCDGSQVFVTTSVRAGIGLMVRALKLAPASGWVEDPGYFGFKGALRSGGIEPCMAPVDAGGLDVDAAARLHPEARLAIVTPTAHFPTGAEMSAERRAKLIAWARGASGWIFEDDYDSENHFEGLPSQPIAAAAPDVTIYMNSFNRTLFPALRIAYMVLPESLIGAVERERSDLDGHTNVPNQIVMADFITGGGLDEHLRRCRGAYRERRDALLGALETDLRAFLSPHRTPGGLQVVADLSRLDEREAEGAAQGAGIQLTGMSRFLDTATRPPQVVVGFAGFKPADIALAARKLSVAFEQLIAHSPGSPAP